MKSNILKRVISLTLAVLIALSVIAGIAFSYFANAETYDDTMIKFDCYNPTKKEDLIDISVWDDINNQVIQGGRSANSLIVYDSKYSKSKTGTNEFGIEIIVDDKGVVTAVGKGDLTINKTGYIISGHGDKAKWLEKYATVGAVLAINTTKKFVCVLPQDEQAVKVIYDSINNIFNKIMDTYNQANDGIFDIDYTKAKELIESATGIYNECASLVSVDKAMQLIENKFNLIQLEEDIKKICTVSRIAEERGVWVRPSQTTQQDVENYVKGIAQSNLTTIYLETWFNGYTIFPTQNQITKQNPIFNGFDVLKAYVDACKKYDLKLHAWVENFFVGMESVDNGGIVIAAKPEWLMKSKAGTTYENTIYGKCYFINPAMKECRSFVLSIYEEIIKNYDIDGLQLDYVRYPEKVSDETDFGYDDTTMNGFKSETGIDPLSIQ
ncbi:MAG: family 10 glycosylhydrolase, partial [Clostridia bacterium]